MHLVLIKYPQSSNETKLSTGFIFLLCPWHLQAQSSFVKVKAHQFFLNNKPYYYIGANYWYGGFLGLESDQAKGAARLRKELDFLKASGITNLRVLAATEGSGMINGVNRVKPTYQPEQGKFDQHVLDGLDLFLFEMGKRQMKAVLYLSNNWEWSGGFLQYLRWNDQIPDSIFRRKMNWDEQRDYTSKFYTCTECMQSYQKQVSSIINRTNKYSHKKYSQDAAIMAWELANEPRAMRPAANSMYTKWINKTSAFIKSTDKNHLVTLGHEGDMATDLNTGLYRQIHSGKNVDYLTIHIWPKNWGWLHPETLEKDMPVVQQKTKDYLAKHIAVASELNKPIVVEEFGLPRNDHSFDINAATTLRNDYYSTIFSDWNTNKKMGGPLAGVNFWAFSGAARPIPGQTFWKEGDDYMGDPPMEEQGLNGVFDSDTSTWNLIGSYTKKNSSTTKAAAGMPSDKMATKETINLYNNLKKLLGKGIMLGHQDDLAYGVGWKYVTGKSDVKDVTGDYPAIYGWELGGLELDQKENLDSVPFSKMKSYIRDTYNRGGVTTISWHLHNPLTGKTAWDPAPGTVESVLPGGQKHELYISWLNKIAAFLHDLKGKNGEAIPVIFRPFHEGSGSWFWWGENHCTPEQFKQLYQFTITYLRSTKKVHNLLYGFNYDRFSSEEEYLQRYPGDDFVDVIGFDIYQRNNSAASSEEFAKKIDKLLTTLEEVAGHKNKIPAITEFGFDRVPDSTWWTSIFLPAISKHKISYALGWRNAGLKASGENEYYLPYKGQVSANDFIKFYNDKTTLFQSDVTKEKLYK